MTTLVLPIMFDLTTHGTEIIPGPGTNYTLEEAAMVANQNYHTLTLFTACEAAASPWRHINMGRLCETWFNRRWLPHGTG